ncbi:MAG: type II secretion system F family protein [Rhodocyclaceae bacterium]|nr:type II secretion system F family protein [Rhodocyclaceae bacterium]
MALYAYKAMDSAGRLRRGRIDAINVIDLEMRLKRMGLDLIAGESIPPGSGLLGAPITRRDLIAVCFHLEQLIRAGVPLLEALNDLRDSTDNPRLAEVLADLIERVEGGQTFSEALAAHPKIFDGVFVSLVRAGEASGRLPEVLANLTETLKWQDEIAAQTKKLVAYPSFLALVVLSVIFFLMVYLVPQMMGFIRNMGHELPLHTRLLIATSAAFVAHWPMILALPVLGGILLTVLVRVSPAFRLRFDAFKLRLPFVGSILEKIMLARFSAALAMLYASGISVLDALSLCKDVVGNHAIRLGIERAARFIAEGQNITLAFQNVGLFPPLVIRMLRVGESTGALDVALKNVHYFYDRDVREAIARLQTLIEPALTVIVGAILGWVMLSVLGPIYDTITRLRF